MSNVKKIELCLAANFSVVSKGCWQGGLPSTGVALRVWIQPNSGCSVATLSFAPGVLFKASPKEGIFRLKFYSLEFLIKQLAEISSCAYCCYKHLLIFSEAAAGEF